MSDIDIAVIRELHAHAMKYPKDTCTSPVPECWVDLGEWAAEHLPAVLDALEADRTRIAELESRSEKRRIRMVVAEEDIAEVRGMLSPQGYPRRIPDEMDIGESVAPAVEWLLGRVAELEAAQRPPLGNAATEPLGYVGATVGRVLVTTMMFSRREDLVTDRPHYEVWRADAFTPAKPAAYAVVFDGGGDPQIDTGSLDGSLNAAERRMHSWLSGDYQAYVVALVQVREVRP